MTERLPDVAQEALLTFLVSRGSFQARRCWDKLVSDLPVRAGPSDIWAIHTCKQSCGAKHRASIMGYHPVLHGSELQAMEWFYIFRSCS